MPDATAFVLSGLSIFAFLALYGIVRRRRFRFQLSENRKGSVEVRFVEVNDEIAIQVFQRPGGSYGYYFCRSSLAYDGSKCWVRSFDNGPGSAFDTVERAELAARECIEKQCF